MSGAGPAPGRGRGSPAAARPRRTGSTRDRALLALLSGTGLRLAEAAALGVDDVPTTERTVPLPADAPQPAAPLA